MTKHLHRNEDLEINNNTLNSLRNLSSQSGKVCISGEGDPLAAWENLLTIIESGPENINYELITSSFWNMQRTRRLLETLSRICEAKNCTLAYRISIDQFHAKEINRDVLEILISIFVKQKLSNASLQIRSITGQEKYVFDRLQGILQSKNIQYDITKLSEIDYKLNTNCLQIKLQFKPTVLPSNFDYLDEWPIDRYIDFLEKSRNTEFHIGLLNNSMENPVFDTTINPDGTVVLYGAEPFVLGNITKEVFTYELLKQRVLMNKNLTDLISARFIDLVNMWRSDSKQAELIEKVNNPFWLIRNLHEQNLLTLHS
ncbi:SMC-Scp complex subunit ScpB [Pedobacter planticolens]|nr:hypothetical protein [Pedobacter planticolens]